MLGSNYGYVFSNCKFDGANYFLKNRDWGIVSRISSERIKQDWNLSAEKGWVGGGMISKQFPREQFIGLL